MFSDERRGRPIASLHSIECKCPMCKAIHVQRIIWNRSTRPWIYCKTCQPKVSSRSSHAEISTQYVPSSAGYL